MNEYILILVYLSFRPGVPAEFKQFPPYATMEACVEDKKLLDANIKTGQHFARCFKRKKDKSAES